MKALVANMRKISICSLLLILALVLSLSAGPGDPVIPTYEWIDIYGNACLLNGKPLPVGAVIDAYDPDGIHCGQWIVEEAGVFGFMPVYRDYPGKDPDEGADPGDTITLTINGVVSTQQLGPDLPVWTAKGDNYEVNLSSIQQVSFDLKSPIGQFTSPGQILIYKFRVKNTGSGIDLFDLAATSQHGWITEIATGNPTIHIPAGDSVEVRVRLFVPSDLFASVIDTLSLQVTSRMDNTITQTGKIISTVIYTSVEDDNSSILPGKFALSQNYPNPFNPETIISYTLEQSGDVRLEIFNILGQSAAVLINQYQEAGTYQVSWKADSDGANYPSGIYFYRLTVSDQTLTRKMILMK